MNTHAAISDDELLLYHYRDGLDSAQRARIAAALLARPELSHRLQTLLAELDAVAAIPEVPVPLGVQQRWHAAIDRSAATTSPPQRRLLQQWRWPALAALTAAVIAIAVRLDMHSTAERATPLISAEDSTRYEYGLKWHLASVEQKLAGFSATSNEQRAVLIDAVIAQNRIFARAAERGGDQRLAGALRSFTLILERLARDAGSNGEARAEIAQLDFELRVMQARLAAKTGTAPSVTL